MAVFARAERNTFTHDVYTGFQSRIAEMVWLCRADRLATLGLIMKQHRFFNRQRESSTNLTRQELIEAMREPGCALCDLAQRKSLRYVETLLETAVMDVDQRDDWRHAGGFCPSHAEMALSIPNVAGSLAILYADVLQHEMAGLSRLFTNAKFSWWQRRQRRLKQRVQRWLHVRRRRIGCPICRSWQTQEDLYWAVLLDHGEDDDMIHAFTQSDGLCLPHTASLLQFDAAHAHLPTVLAAQHQCLQRLHGDLNVFIRKQDYQFAQEPYGQEADAWQRVVACLVGRRYGRASHHQHHPDMPP